MSHKEEHVAQLCNTAVSPLRRKRSASELQRVHGPPTPEVLPPLVLFFRVTPPRCCCRCCSYSHSHARPPPAPAAAPLDPVPHALDLLKGVLEVGHNNIGATAAAAAGSEERRPERLGCFDVPICRLVQERALYKSERGGT